MKTYIADIIPKIQRFSRRIDEVTLLINQHWVLIDEISTSKNVYIFRPNNELLISHNGKVEKAKWEYLGNNSLLIDRKEESFLFKQGFFDENVLALKVDSSEEYAILLNENNYSGELNSVKHVLDFLTNKYIDSSLNEKLDSKIGYSEKGLSSGDKDLYEISQYSDKGNIIFRANRPFSFPLEGCSAFLNGENAPDGKYKLGFMWYCYIENGVVTGISVF